MCLKTCPISVFRFGKTDVENILCIQEYCFRGRRIVGGAKMRPSGTAKCSDLEPWLN